MNALSYARGPDLPVLEMTIGQVISETAARFAEREALVVCHQNVRLTWREFDQQIERTARGLAGLGLRRQDRVGIWSSNCLEWVLLQMACARAGFVLVNLNPAYRSHDLGLVLQKSRMRVLVLRDKDARADYKAILEEARAGRSLPLEHTIWLGTESWTRMLENGRPLPADPILPHHAANIQYTSGTTGIPKGVVLTHRNLVNNAWLGGHGLGVTEQDRVCNPCPLYHCAGSVVAGLSTLVRGAALILPSAQFDAGALLRSIETERGTAVGGVPTMFTAALEHPELSRLNLQSLRLVWMGGAPCPVPLLQRVKDNMGRPQVIVLYGQTESSPLITMTDPQEDFEKFAATVGQAMPNTEVKIVSPATGETLRTGEAGELCSRGYMVMAGYDEEPEATSRAIDADGWLHTGDIAVMTPDQHFQITGRAKEMIIRGGENIYPREVEEFLLTHPRIAEVSVVGLPDERLGEIVAAWIRLTSPESASEAEIREFCRGRIAHFKVPQHVRFVESFPSTASGKVQKFRIQQMEIEARGIDQQAGATTR
jgi:fatty-acyl-CoA synthase